MSLNYDLTACDPEKIYDADGDWLPFVQPMIFTALVTDIGTITEDNYLEFWQRANVFELIHGITPTTTLDQCVAMIGLRTNVFPQTTRAKWLKRVVGTEMDAKIAAADSLAERAAFEVDINA